MLLKNNMVTFFEASLLQLSIHKIGNKLLNEPCVLSDRPVAVDDEMLNGLLMQYFLSPFTKVSEVYRFTHSSGDLNLNELFHFSGSIFNDHAGFHETGIRIARHLYDITGHPNIKSGELYLALFRNVQIEGRLLDALGIFKSENKEAYLKVYSRKDGFELGYEQEAINIQKLDKGCLVFNTEQEEGYRVVVVDQTNRQSEAVYWKDEFLKLKVRSDDFTHTTQALQVYKQFVTEKLDEEFEMTRLDKIDLLNRSMRYFREKETFDLDEFGEEVIGNPQAVASFRDFKQSYEAEFETGAADSFGISPQAVKKQGRVYKSVLKLDRNFHIYIHGNRDLIEKGFDNTRNMNFYKVYYSEEK